MNRATVNHISSARPAWPQASLFAIVGLLIGLASTVETWRRRSKAKIQFSRIDARILRDAGISETQRFILSQL